MILLSGILKDREIQRILSKPEEYIESGDYFSWERFFTAVLTEKTKGTYLAYSKKLLNQSYLSQSVKKEILAQMDKIILD